MVRLSTSVESEVPSCRPLEQFNIVCTCGTGLSFSHINSSFRKALGILSISLLEKVIPVNVTQDVTSFCLEKTSVIIYLHEQHSYCDIVRSVLISEV